MKEGAKIVLDQNLKELNLTIMLSHYPTLVRQAKESGISYEEFLLSLTEMELRIRGRIVSSEELKRLIFPC